MSTYDFSDLTEGKAIPYGVYDIADDSAWVSVGVDHDTSVFATATIDSGGSRWDSPNIRNATRLLITANGGGSVAGIDLFGEVLSGGEAGDRVVTPSSGPSPGTADDPQAGRSAPVIA